MREAMGAIGLVDRDRVGVRTVGMSDRNGLCIALDQSCTKFVQTREYFYQKINPSTGLRETFVLQEHTMGHVLGETGKVSAEPPHFNLRRCHPQYGSQVHDQSSILSIPVRDACKEGVKKPNSSDEHFYAVSPADQSTWKANHQKYMPNEAWTKSCNRKCN